MDQARARARARGDIYISDPKPVWLSKLLLFDIAQRQTAA